MLKRNQIATVLLPFILLALTFTCASHSVAQQADEPLASSPEAEMAARKLIRVMS